MNRFEQKSEFARESQRVLNKVRIREIGAMGSTSNFWESSNGWKRNQSFAGFLFAIDKKHKLVFEECANYSSTGNCTEWLDVTDSPNVIEFRKQISELVSEIENSGRRTKELKLVEIINTETMDLYSYILCETWKPSNAERLFLEFKKKREGKIGIVFSSREEEKDDFREIDSKSTELRNFKDALNARLKELRESREADSNDRNTLGKPKIN